LTEKSYDLCFSINCLEHIPESSIDNVIREMARATKRGFHGIHMTDSPYEEHDIDYDSTHVTLHPMAWWVERFKAVAPEYPVIIMHERELQYTKPERVPPSTPAPGMYMKANGDIIADDLLHKVNFGCFRDMFYFGWINVDILDMKGYADQFGFYFVQHDVTKPFPIQDNIVDLVFSSHLLEHLSREEGYAFLQECHRILKTGGIIRLSVPDSKKITKDYVDGKIRDHRFINTGVSDADDDALAYYNLLLASHKTVYDEESLKAILAKIGFKNIEKSTPFTSRSESIVKQTITSHPTISCVMEAEK